MKGKARLVAQETQAWSQAGEEVDDGASGESVGPVAGRLTGG